MTQGANEPEGPLDAERPDDVDAPRRAASARFDVAAREDAGLRDALDPATQSLGEALRLSYRILQLGILALVFLFLLSGFQSVKEGDTGVKTLFGAISGAEGEEQLQSGFQPFWPYPVGDFVVFEEKRTIRLDAQFWPARRNQGDLTQKSLDEQIDSADASAGLRPGNDGYVLTREGDIAHAQVEAEYRVADAVRFLKATSPQAADRLVTSILEQATVEAASTLTLAELTETRDLLGPAIRERAQRSLDRLDTGIELASVRGVERSAPFAVQNRLREVQTGREAAKAEVERARQEAGATLTSIAGGEVYVELLRLIRAYEENLGAGRAAEADAVLAQLGARMEAADVGGEVSRTIQRAKASETALRARLEREVERLESLAGSSGGANAQIVRQLWLDAVREVLENPQAEVFASPNILGSLSLRLQSSGEVMQARRDAEIQRKKAEQQVKDAGGFYAPNSDQIYIGKPGRRLKRDASGGVGR
jgi:regulator of protease activity HflC (stomatin/prohibitin superfamily)